MTQTWRLESFALLVLWAAATALLVVAAQVPPPPAPRWSRAHPAALPAASGRRPPSVRPRAPAPPPQAAITASDPARPAADDADQSATVATETVDVTTLSDVDFDYEGEGGSPDDSGDQGFYHRYSAHYLRRWGHAWEGRRGLVLRPAAGAFFAPLPATVGTSGDPCDVIPGACSAALGGGVFAPPASALTPTRRAVLARREYAAPAAVTHEGDRWSLGNDQLTIDIDALCRMTSRRVDAPTPAVASFAPPVAARCVARETAVPWDDRTGAAIELSWTAPGGSMRAVVALADDGDDAEASVARTDASGETWLTNLGKVTLTWTVGGSAVTVTPGGAVRVTVRRLTGA